MTGIVTQVDIALHTAKFCPLPGIWYTANLTLGSIWQYVNHMFGEAAGIWTGAWPDNCFS